MSQGDAALFVGAGLSRPAGYVDWKSLLRDIAEELRLDIELESDLVALAQYHVNTTQSRTRLNRILLEEFTRDVRPTAVHELIAQLPVKTIWTTNYDTLVEDALKAAGKRPDVKITQENLAITRPKRDVTLYKMHGDISQPQDAVLTKDDYETYSLKRDLFTIALKGDLVSKTFLFAGFSFTDPNIDFILSRVRSLLGQNQREHYCIMKQLGPAPSSGEALARHEYEQTKLALRIADLRRYSIQALLIDDYLEVEQIFSRLVRLADRNNIFVSGSAAEYGVFSQARLEGLARLLGSEIIRRGYNLVSGFGLGVGASVLVGAMEGAYRDDSASFSDRALLRPFPGPSAAFPELREAYRRYRREMLHRARFAVFLAGNRVNREGTGIEIAEGVIEEFRIALEEGVVPIPVGATGYAAAAIHTEVVEQQAALFAGADVQDLLSILNDPSAEDSTIVDAIFTLIERVQRRL